MKILIISPGDEIGRRVVQELLAPEFIVRVLTRDPAWLPVEWREQVEVVRSAADDPEAWREALSGIEAVLWRLPGKTDAPGQQEHLARVASRAVREAGTRRVVTIANGHDGPAALEAIMNESGAAIRHVRRGGHGEEVSRRTVSMEERLGLPLPVVGATDVADVVLRWLVRRDWSGNASVMVQGARRSAFTSSQAAGRAVACAGHASPLVPPTPRQLRARPTPQCLCGAA